MSNEAIAEPAVQSAGEGQGLDAELQALGRLAAEVDGFAPPKVEDQAPRKTGGVPSAGKKESAEKAEQRTASTANSEAKAESDDPTTREIKSLDVGEDRERSRNRLGQLWEQFNAKQREFAEQRAKWEAEVEQLKSAPPKNPRDGYSPKELREFAKEWENEGRDDLADEARKRASQIEEEEDRNSRLNKQRQAEFENRVKTNWTNLVKENPDYNDQGSDLYQVTMNFMQHQDPLVRDFLNRHPDGLVLASALAKLQIAGESAADAVKEVARLKAENEKLKSKFSLGSSNPVAPMGDKSMKDMSTAEAEAHVRAMAMQADGLI